MVDPKTGKARRVSSGDAFGCQPFVDLDRNVAGVFLAHARTMKRSSTGLPYNDASVVYLQLRAILSAILDGKPLPEADFMLDATPQPPRQSEAPQDGLNLHRLLRLADRNGDGALSRDEIPERMQMLRRAFDWLDRDGNGELSREELTRGTRALQQRTPRHNRLAPDDCSASSSARKPWSPRAVGMQRLV